MKRKQRQPRNKTTGSSKTKRVIIQAPWINLEQLSQSYLLILIVAFTLLAYQPALKAGFIWDDDYHFSANPYMLNIDGLKKIWTTPAAMYYPLVLTVWWFMRRVFDLSPLPYHLITLIFHILNVLLFYVLLKRLKIPGAICAAGLFALHPVHVESVAWATELKNTLSGFFYLLSLLFYSRFIETNTIEGIQERSFKQKSRIWYALALISFITALLSKPSTVMLPLVIILLLWWLKRKLNMQAIMPVLPFTLFAIFSAVWTILEQKYHSRALGEEWELPLTGRVILAGRVVWFYLSKLILPLNLSFIYPRWDINPAQIFQYSFILCLLLSVLILLLLRFTWSRAFLFALLYYLILLFPVMGFFNIYFMRYSYVADHFQYLASLGPLAFLGAGWQWIGKRLKPNLKPLSYIMLLFILGVMAYLTWQQTHIYENEETLWLDTIKKNPRAVIAYNNLGLIYLNRGELDLSLKYLLKALELKPNSAEIYNGLGKAFVLRGEVLRGIECFKKAIELDPNYLPAQFNLQQLQPKLSSK